MTWRTIVWVLYGASALAEASIFIRMFADGIRHRWPWFFAFVGATLGETISLTAVYLAQPRLYPRVWVFTCLVVIALESAAVLEIFSQWSRSFPDIGTLGRRLLASLLTLSVAFSLSTLHFHASTALPGWYWSEASQSVSILNRTITIALAFFLGLTLLFFRRYGGVPSFNMRRHSWTMLAFLTANTLGWIAATYQAFRWANGSLVIASFGIQVIWIFALRPMGDSLPVRSATTEDLIRWSAAEEFNAQMVEWSKSLRLTGGGLRRR